MLRILSLLLLMSISFVTRPQTQFLVKGKIEFERKINVHKQLDPDEDSEWYKDFVAKQPRFYTSYFDLHFSGNKTLYKPGKETDPFRNWWLIGPSKENVVIADMETQLMNSQKKVFEEIYLLQDTIGKIEWKITEELRTIAGFECRKAVAIMCDSVYVVAFYTDEIAVTGGPESFNGLPGMILGLAIPRLYTTWFATKVELIEPKPTDFVIPSKGKKITEQNLQGVLQRSLKDWGKQGQRNIWWVML
ncbi:MAG: GLPGLI family protein [Chitinophagaceae bacterium]|nr:GLPGLI family protein [Chitinophagaceae bacterium]